MSLRYILIILLLMWAASADHKIDELTARLDAAALAEQVQPLKPAQQAIREALITGRPTTLKWTCDAQGNWRQVAVHLERVGNGWREVAVATQRRAA